MTDLTARERQVLTILVTTYIRGFGNERTLRRLRRRGLVEWTGPGRVDDSPCWAITPAGRRAVGLGSARAARERLAGALRERLAR
jgi:hypothetical protein